MNLKIGSYNIQHGRHYGYFLETGDKKEKIDLDNIVGLIKSEDLDICGLQEVFHQTYEGNKLGEQVKYIAEQLGYQFVFGKAIDWNGNTQNQYGVGLVTKHEILSTRSIYIALPQEEKNDPRTYYEDRVVFVVELSVHGKPLTVINTHFGLAPGEQLLAIQAVREVMENLKNPVVLMGDLNTYPTTDKYALLEAIPNLNDVAALMGDKTKPHTYPSDLQSHKIDYLFVSDELKSKLKSHKIVDVTYADHVPYIMEVEW